MYDVTIFGIHLKLNPVAFTLPFGSGWKIYWYGIIIATGFLLALLYALKNAPRLNINADKLLDCVLVTTPVSILCARAYYVIFDPATTFANFFNFSSSGFSGLAIYGAVIGAFVCGWLMCRIKKLGLRDVFDLTAICFLIGQCIGRWGNFINQEAYGSFTGSTFWGMQSNVTVNEMGGEGLVHPCFLYESVWCLLGFLLLHKFSRNRKFSGQIILSYGVWYGFGRGFIELLRTDSLMLGAFRISSLLSFLLCVGCGITLYIGLKRQKAAVHESDYGDQFADETLSNTAMTDETENENEYNH